MEETHNTHHSTQPPRPSNPTGRGLIDDARALGDDAAALARDAKRTKNQVQELVTQRVSENPYAALAAAAGLGFVVAGGLSPAVLRTVTGLAGRIALVLLTKRAVALIDDGDAGQGSSNQ